MFARWGGPFDGLDGISHDGHAAVLSALAEIDPAVVLGRIERSLSQEEDLSALTDEVRDHLVGALEKIAFHRATFQDAAHLLLRLAAADEPQSRSSASRDFGRFNQVGEATGTFSDLFSMHLGGTEADGDARLRFLDKVAATNGPDSARGRCQGSGKRPSDALLLADGRDRRRRVLGPR